jgi:hypothetical protein
VFVDDDAFGIATIRKTSEVLIRRVKGEDHVGAELLQAGLAIWAGVVRIHHATDRNEIARFVLGHCRPDLCDTADDLVARNNRIVRGHELAPFITNRMQVGVADAAKQDFDLHVAIGRISTFDFGGSQWRFVAGGGISLRVVSSRLHVADPLLIFIVSSRL